MGEPHVGSWFRAKDEFFQRLSGEPRDFGGSVGVAISAGRARKSEYFLLCESREWVRFEDIERLNVDESEVEEEMIRRAGMNETGRERAPKPAPDLTARAPVKEEPPMAGTSVTKERVSVAFDKIASLAIATGAAPISQIEGLWSYQLPGGWTIEVNGHEGDISGVPPYHARVLYNDWPAGLIYPYGGIIAAGSAVNEDGLIAALEAELQRLSEASSNG